MPETCDNCGETIGDLETPRVWKDHIVCGKCHRRLQHDTDDQPANSVDPSEVVPQDVSHSGPVDSTFRCPKCGSADTKKLSVVFNAGTRIGTSTSTHIGAAFDDDGVVPVVGGSSSTSVHQTNLAAMAAPPVKPELKSPGLGVAISVMLIFGGGLAFLSKINDRYERGVAVFGAILAVAGIIVLIMVIRGYKDRQRKHEVDVAQYRKSYSFWLRRIMCMRCGNIYIPEAAAEPVSSAISPKMPPVASPSADQLQRRSPSR